MWWTMIIKWEDEIREADGDLKGDEGTESEEFVNLLLSSYM